MTTPLPLPDDPRLAELGAAWDRGEWYGLPYPRSKWLHAFEAILREHYPQSSSKQRTLTARLAAPFPLARPGVP